MERRRRSAHRSVRRHPAVGAAEAPAPTALDRWLLRRALRALGCPPVEVVLWNGDTLRVCSEAPSVRLRVHEPSVLRSLVRGPHLALGEAYADGRVEVEGDLVRALELVFRSARRASGSRRSPLRALGQSLRLNTRGRARSNVHHHYDLGNDFYRLWLDEQMVYTCAYFPTPGAGLEEAQLAKLDHVCRKLALRPGERVFEAGCGWGALALHMAERYGVRVRAFNVSREQITYARQEARDRGLERAVEFVEEDYRAIHGHCDAFVSVGMLEHVGRAHYRTLGRVIDRCLAPDGRGLLHFISHVRPTPTDPWLRRHIFPGAHLPALSEMLPVLEPHELAVLDVEDLGRHYARTLEHWLERFEKAAGTVENMYDERFVRAWRLYLASSITAFRTGSCQLLQILFCRAGGNPLPWTRDYMYAQGGRQPHAVG